MRWRTGRTAVGPGDGAMSIGKALACRLPAGTNVLLPWLSTQATVRHHGPRQRGLNVVTITRWTGTEARILREVALRMNIYEFADHTNLSTSTVRDIENKGERAQLRTSTQKILDETLAAASEEAKRRFEASLGSTSTPSAPPEAAFLGHGSIVVCAPTRREEVGGRPVISVADNAAAQLVADTARTAGLRTRFELIPDGGDVDLNRANLVAICGPRMSRAVAGILTQDRRFEFFKEDDGPWVLRDSVTGMAYRSGQDQVPIRPWDAAYLGRLLRPDGAGMLLLIAGIHPQGSLGVAHLIATRLAELHRDTAGASFSVLVGTEYDPETGEPTQVSPLTPVCRWDVQLTNAGIHRE